MNDIRLSIIVPVYKIDELLLRQCLKSFIVQQESFVEFIVVDDGSPDNCGEIIDDYANQDNRIKAIHTENHGVSNARNIGLGYAKGEYIAFVDGDDYIEPDFCAKVVSAMEKAGTDILYFMHRTTSENDVIESIPDESIEKLSDEKLKEVTIGVVSQENPIKGIWTGSPWGKVFKHSIIAKNKLQFVVGLRKSQDRVFVLDYLLYVNSAAIYKYVGYHYVINETSVCQRYNKEIVSILSMAGREFEKRKDLIPYKAEYNSAINTMYMIFFCECMLLDFFNHDNKNNFMYKMTQMKNLLDNKKFRVGIKTGNLNAISRKRRLIVLAARHNMCFMAGVLAVVLFR